MEEYTLDKLIQEGENILSQIHEVEYPEDVICTFIDYEIPEHCKYERWKNLVIRFLSYNFPEDRCIKDFEEATFELKKHNNSPEVFEKMIGILVSCKMIPSLPKTGIQNSKIDKSVNVNIHQTQSQSQTNTLNIFLDIIKDEITGKQWKEIKSIAVEEPDSQKAKSKILDKIKSWGENTSASIIANIITNPTIWGCLI